MAIIDREFMRVYGAKWGSKSKIVDGMIKQWGKDHDPREAK